MKSLTLYSVDFETLRRKQQVNFTLKDGKAVGKWAPGSKSIRVWLERDGVGTVDGFVYPTDGAKFLRALRDAVLQSSTMAVEEGG